MLVGVSVSAGPRPRTRTQQPHVRGDMPPARSGDPGHSDVKAAALGDRRRFFLVPLGAVHQPGCHEFESLEEGLDLAPAAQPQRYRTLLVRGLDLPLPFGVLISRPVRQDQVTAGSKRLHQGAYDAVRILLVGQEVKEREQRQGHGRSKSSFSPARSSSAAGSRTSA